MGMKTIKFFATLGLHEGYFHENNSVVEYWGKAERIWQEEAEVLYQKTGVFIGAVFVNSKTVYHREWGCPEGGEDTVFITGECNPFYTNPDIYKERVLELLRIVVLRLKQATSQISFLEVDFEYLDFR